MLELLNTLAEPTKILLSLAILLFAGFIVTRVTKKFKLPNVTGYILAGILIGPSVLNWIPQDMISGMDFITDIALSYISFGAGKYFKLAAVRKNGFRVMLITIFESFIAATALSLTFLFVFHLSLSFSLLLGAIGCATAPASTIMTIRQYRAKGIFVNTALQVIAFDNAVSLIAFSICAGVANSLSQGAGISLGVIAIPFFTNILVIALGIGAGFLLHQFINSRRSSDHRLVLVNGIIFTLTGLCSAFSVSPLLCCMALGTTYINLSGNKNLFKQVNRFTPPILLLFFVLSGMKLNISSLASVGLIGIAYFLIRIAAKYAGAWLGAFVSKAPVAVQNYLGLALIPQAGVSIGLASLGQRILPPDQGTLLSTVILSSAVLYEMIGPACAKASLFLSGAISSGPFQKRKG